MFESQQAKISIREAFVFELIENAAKAGNRCPTNLEIATLLVNSGLVKKYGPSAVPRIFMQLVRTGLLTVRVYGQNWREAVILSGPNAGKSTLRPSHGRKPYVVIDILERERRDAAGSGFGLEAL